jgi:hypothetical protein
MNRSGFDVQDEGSFFDADHPATGVPFARRSTVVGERPAPEPHPIADEVRRQADAALVS